MNIEKIHKDKITPNGDNPRNISEDKFEKLVNSIKEFPNMLDLRPLVLDKNNIILGGNMRYQACIEAGIEEIPCMVFTEKHAEENNKRTGENKTYMEWCMEFIIKDNVGFGQWDWDILANKYEEEQLVNWGLDVIKHNWDDLDAIDEDIETPLLSKNKLVITIPEELMDEKNDIEDGVKEYLSENYSGCEVK